MPMTQTKAQNLLDTYQNELNSVNDRLEGFYKVEGSDGFKFIPGLLDALNTIADPATTTALESFEKAQKHLASSVEMKFNYKGNPRTTMFESFDNSYSKNGIFKQLQSEIKEGLKMPSELQAQIHEGSILKAVSIAEAPSDVTDWAFWLECGLLGASLVASLALCVTAAITLNPVLGGVGVAATVVSAVALARTIGLFNPNTAASELLSISKEMEEENARSSVSMQSE